MRCWRRANPIASELSWQRGTATIELALSIPVLVLLLTGLFDIGSALHQALEVQTSADAGARYAAQHPSPWDAAAIASAVTNATEGSGISAVPSPIRVCGCAGGTPFEIGPWDPVSGACPLAQCTDGAQPGVYAKISATATYQPVLPYPGLSGTLIGIAYRRID